MNSANFSGVISASLQKETRDGFLDQIPSKPGKYCLEETKTFYWKSQQEHFYVEDSV